MQLSQKSKTFSQVFDTLLKTKLNFEHFEKKMILIANVFPKLETAKEEIEKISKETRFRTLFDSQHAKGSQTLLKIAAQHLYHIF